MTVSANSSLDFQVDTLCRLAYQLTGLLPAGSTPSAADLGMARDLMNLELMALQAEGTVLRTVERSLLTLGTPDVGTVATYTLPSDTIDIELGPNDQLGSIVDSGGSETVCLAMSRADYLDITDKTASVTARSTRGYVEKLATVTVTFWPAPDSSAVSFRYARTRLLRDADTGGVTIDLARRWLKFVTFATAAHLARAKSLPQEDIQDLRGEAERMKAVCQADDQQRGKTRFRLAHSGRRW